MANLEGMNCWEDDTTGCVCGNECELDAATIAAWGASETGNAAAIRHLMGRLGPEAARRAAIAATCAHFHAAGVAPSAASAILAIFGVTRAELVQAQTDLKEARENGI